MQFSESDIEKINNAANLLEVITDFVDMKKQGASYYGVCPMCNKSGKGKGLIVTPSKKIYKCFSCDFGGKHALNFLMDSQNKSYPEALKYLADKYNIFIEQKPLRGQKKAKPSTKALKSFRDKQLESSGLTNEDQKASVYVDEKTRKMVDVYQTGTRDQYGQIVEGDDMIIWYYDLHGKPVQYQKPKSNKFESLFRIRWQNPDLHLDKFGKPIKYQSPAGSGSHIYIPETVRRAFASRQYQKRLYIQEGEKKADKACKHGLFSVGIMGIHNIAGKEKVLPYELQIIIKTLQIQEVVFLVDSDFDQISNNIQSGDAIDYKPRSFFRAVCNFRDYFKALSNSGLYLEIYFAHVKHNENNDKGIDDLFVNTLKGRENELLDDVNKAINEKSGSGQFLQFYKITTQPETKIIEIWGLNDAQAFILKHKSKLETLNEFKFNHVKWRFTPEGKLELSQPLMDDEQYWEIREYKDNQGNVIKTDYRFRYMRLYNCLANRGFGRIMMADGKFQFAHMENQVVKTVDNYFIKDFIIDLTKQIVKDEEIIDMLYRGGKMYLGPDSLSNMMYINPVFQTPNRYAQNLYFNNKYWHITAEGIEEKSLFDMEATIWFDNINKFDAKLIKKPLVDITPINDSILKQLPASKREEYEPFKGQYFVDISPEGNNCHFLRFLWNTGEFYWEKITFNKNREIVSDNRTLAEKIETNLHMASKMSAIGYLLHRYRNKTDAKAVIAVDGKNLETGSSNGRTGKSALGFAIEKIIPCTYVPGKSRHLTDDRFIFEEVNEKTCVIFIDDVRANIEFEFFFPFIGGKATIEKKAIGKFTLPDDQTPKLYITTNHAINGEGSSYRDRQFYIAFSDYYNDKWKPVNDFGIHFFDEWDSDQWNLFYNFMAQCLQTYLKYGLIKQSDERIEKRRLRQEVGEFFLSWADEYFSYDGGKANANINIQIPRNDLKDNCLEKCPNYKKYYTPNDFKKRFKKWCAYNNLAFNPHRVDKFNNPGADDKSNGIEYFTVSNEEIEL